MQGDASLSHWTVQQEPRESEEKRVCILEGKKIGCDLFFGFSSRTIVRRVWLHRSFVAESQSQDIIIGINERRRQDEKWSVMTTVYKPKSTQLRLDHDNVIDTCKSNGNDICL